MRIVLNRKHASVLPKSAAAQRFYYPSKRQVIICRFGCGRRLFGTRSHGVIVRQHHHDQDVHRAVRQPAAAHLAPRHGGDGPPLVVDHIHPFIARVARAKLLWRESPKALRLLGTRVARVAEKEGGSADGYAPLVTKCYPAETLARLRR